MFSMAIGSFAMWFSIIISCIVIFAFLIFKKEHNIWLYIVNGLLSFIIFLSISMIMFSFGTKDTEILNGCVTTAKYYEKWTEYYYVTVCNSRDDKGNCTSYRTEKRTSYHPPYWEIDISTGHTKSISQSQFKNYTAKFGSKFVDIPRFNQDSVGDGNAYFSDVPYGEIPASVYNSYTNYVLASQETILKNRINEYPQFKGLITNYPTIVSTEYGTIKFPRIIDVGTTLSTQSLNILQKYLDDELTSLGASKQINIIIYLVNTPDQSFIHALEGHWIKGKKNDLIVVVGVQQKKISWVNLICWTDHELFKVKLKDRIMEIGSLETEENLLLLGTVVMNQIRKGGEEGFQRKPMKDYEYLQNDISLSFVQSFWMIFISIFLSGCFIVVYLYNEKHSGSFRGRY